MSNAKALGTLAGVIVVIAIYLVLAGVLGITETWAGFLFLLQWSLMEQMKTERLPNSILGAAVGIAIGYSAAWVTPIAGQGAGLGVMLALVLLATFLFIKQQAGIVINAATMVFLTIATIPHISKAVPADGIYIGLLSGIVYFGGIGLLIAMLTKPKAGAAEPPAEVAAA